MNKRALVTGAGGFIGSHLVEGLVAEGINVRAFVHYNSAGSSGWLDSLDADILAEVEVIAGDVRDSHFVEESISGCDWVFHLAALIGIPYSYRCPDSYVDTNIKGTLNILQAARHSGCERILTTSTSEVYGTARYVPIDEKHPLQGQSPYSATKIGADRLAESFWRSFSTPIVIVRPFNTYGPRQSTRAVIPTIATQVLSGKDSIRLGSLHPTRDLVFVADTVRGFLAIARAEGVVGEEINIATGRECSVADLAGLIVREIGSEVTIEADHERVRPAGSEVDRLLGSNEKIKRLTGWEPSTTLEEGLRETICWYRQSENMSRFKRTSYTI